MSVPIVVVVVVIAVVHCVVVVAVVVASRSYCAVVDLSDSGRILCHSLIVTLAKRLRCVRDGVGERGSITAARVHGCVLLRHGNGAVRGTALGTGHWALGTGYWAWYILACYWR